MSKSTKVILIVVASLAGLIALCVVLVIVAFGAFMSHEVSGSPADKAKAAAKIASFDLPPGYRYALGMDLGFVNTVVIVPPERGPRGFSMELMGMSVVQNQTQDPQTLLATMQKQMGSSSQCRDARSLGTDTLETANGTAVRLAKMSCADGRLMELGSIPSHYSFAMLLAQGAPDAFDRDALQELVRSIRT